MSSEATSRSSAETGPGRSVQSQFDRKADLLALFTAAGVGATAMYFLDPARGSRRRHLVRDKLVHAAHEAEAAVGTTSRDLANRARGLASTVGQQLTSDDADDVVLRDRVRAELGRAVSRPRAIEVVVEQGKVMLRGPVLADEADSLLAHIADVRGVNTVEDRLERHTRPGDVPGLQGAAKEPAPKFELLQENWTPTARFLTMVTGGALTIRGLRDRHQGKPLTAGLGLAGLALFVRGVTNMPFARLVGGGAGRRAVTLQKSINIAAPIDEVFAWLTEWERWPEWMSHVREVRADGPRGAEGERTHWVVDGPAGTAVSWDAVTTRLVPRELVVWKTVEGSPIAHAGRIRFIPTDQGFTRVDVHMSYNPIAGVAGHAVAALFGRDPKRQLDDDLARLKTTIETGQLPHDVAAWRWAAQRTAVDSSQVAP